MLAPITITIIGNGNVAQHLVKQMFLPVFVENNFVLKQIYTRNPTKLFSIPNEVSIIHEISEIIKTDITIIAISDDAIMEVSEKIPHQNTLVLHVSGTASIDRIKGNHRKGVFYPLQSFSKDKIVDFSKIPFCIEAQNEEDLEMIQSLAKCFSNLVYPINTHQRKALHVAAVFVNNFTNHLFAIGQEFCQEHQIPFEILHPLILETANKITYLSPTEAQTGPAKRNDVETIAAHEDFLLHTEYLEIYKILTKAIQNNGKKL